MKKIKNDSIGEINAGVSQAANETFWLTFKESNALIEKGYKISACENLPGWEGVECGSYHKGKIAYQVNTPNGERATLEELKALLSKKN